MEQQRLFEKENSVASKAGTRIDWAFEVRGELFWWLQHLLLEGSQHCVFGLWASRYVPVVRNVDRTEQTQNWSVCQVPDLPTTDLKNSKNLQLLS